MLNTVDQIYSHVSSLENKFYYMVSSEYRLLENIAYCHNDAVIISFLDEFFKKNSYNHIKYYGTYFDSSIQFIQCNILNIEKTDEFRLCINLLPDKYLYVILTQGIFAFTYICDGLDGLQDLIEKTIIGGETYSFRG